jgi:hypothetical protein
MNCHFNFGYYNNRMNLPAHYLKNIQCVCSSGQAMDMLLQREIMIYNYIRWEILNNSAFSKRGVSPKFFGYIVIRENLFVIDFIAGARCTRPYKGQTHGSAPTRYRNLPLYQIGNVE